MDRNRDLFWNLLEPEHKKARAYCRKLMADRDDGDDLYQDSLVRALTRFRSLRDTTSFRPWLYRIITNTFKNRVRRSWWNKLLPISGETDSALVSEDPSPSYAARRRLERAFRVLSPDDRALVTLHELQGWGIQELSAMIGKSEGNIRVRLSRARHKMRKALARKPVGTNRTEQRQSERGESKACVVQKPARD